MKYYTIESHAEKEAPFGIAWQVKLFDGHTLLEEYEHIFYNEIAGYCKCLEDMGFVDERGIGVLNEHWKDNLEKPTSKELKDFIDTLIAPEEYLRNAPLFDSVFKEEPEEYLWIKDSL